MQHSMEAWAPGRIDTMARNSLPPARSRNPDATLTPAERIAWRLRSLRLHPASAQVEEMAREPWTLVVLDDLASRSGQDDRTAHTRAAAIVKAFNPALLDHLHQLELDVRKQVLARALLDSPQLPHLARRAVLKGDVMARKMVVGQLASAAKAVLLNNQLRRADEAGSVPNAGSATAARPKTDEASPAPRPADAAADPPPQRGRSLQARQVPLSRPYELRAQGQGGVVSFGWQDSGAGLHGSSPAPAPLGDTGSVERHQWAYLGVQADRPGKPALWFGLQRTDFIAVAAVVMGMSDEVRIATQLPSQRMRLSLRWMPGSAPDARCLCVGVAEPNVALVVTLSQAQVHRLLAAVGVRLRAALGDADDASLARFLSEAIGVPAGPLNDD